MPDQHGVGIDATLSNAAQAVGQLDRAGFPSPPSSIRGHALDRELPVQGDVTVADEATPGRSRGAVAMGVLGRRAGAVAVWMPGVGHGRVASPMATARRGRCGGIAGAVAGTAWGGV
jgi:hypothetical protein